MQSAVATSPLDISQFFTTQRRLGSRFFHGKTSPYEIKGRIFEVQNWQIFEKARWQPKKKVQPRICITRTCDNKAK
ncbi:Hypothetical protein FKW44_005715 [Caligus rogercresseyi]|uniref:Uncharacterized protein n=1 Tax=Caligus rogercresseyi TaxID=217165 RepID=A0A7T8QS81_CALRO|nr:Hypothetical protein FKW44_005715 [Caligus rogercresseyi]